MATIKDVAKKAHVSVATVSRVINQKGYVNEETKQLVLQAIEELNYVPNELARSLFQKKSHIVAVMMPHLTSYYFSDLLEVIEDETINSNYRLMICNSKDDPEKESKYLKIFDQYNVDGIILISNTLRIDDYLALNIPIIEIDHNLSDEIPSITSNNFLGGKLAAEKLVNSGCKKIIHFRGPSGLVTVQDRTAGFQSVLKAKEIENYTYDLAFISPDPLDIESKINAHLDCDGIFCDSDVIAMLTIQSLKRANKRIPEDVQVIGFDNIQLSNMLEPKITTIEQSTEAIGKAALKSMMKLIHGEELDYFHQTIDVKLIERDTTKKVF
ncbi:MAG: LacI family DNA-binding transcriptional regulator [Candidatus Izemoplasmatales bacterium]|jgi:DNA-binding LacI/PurR family transcriptional regulator|nr:LacI family DNA-binding transcriptional regulator [Candidatus Izemoplasmatales bacterium]